MSLLKQAKQIKSKKRSKYTEEHLELALAYFNGEINLTQMAKVFKSKELSNCLRRITVILKQFVDDKKIIIKYANK